MRTLRLAALAGPLFALLAVAPQANATPLFTATYNLTGGVCGAVVCGTVTLTGTDANDVNISVTSADASNIGFIANGSHSFFLLNVDKTLTFTIPAGSPLVSPPGTGVSQPGQGTFSYGFDCTGNCGPQLSSSTKTFSLSVYNATGLNAGDFTTNASNNTFSVDVTYTANGSTNTGPIGSGPCTGDCGGGGVESVTPEPLSFLLVGSGLIGTFLLRRRRS